MNLFYLCMTMMRFLMISSSAVQSISHSLFVNPSEDPFLDPFIETISHMNMKALLAIPKMNDDEFLRYLLDDDDHTTYAVAARVDTSVFDPLRDNQLKHQTEIDEEWETLMVSGPIVVSYMGNLMVLASRNDTSFRAPANYVYRYIRFPNSLRATLAQVSTDMYNALMGAHTAMDRIQVNIKLVPTQIKSALKLITSGSDAMLASLLPRTLERVSSLASESAEVANSTLLRFNDLQDLLGEIIELSASTQSTNEADINRMNEQKQNSTLEQQRIKESLNAIKNQYDDSKKNLEHFRKQYTEKMELLAASATPEIIQTGGSKPGLVDTALGMVFEPAKTIGCVLRRCSSPTYRVDNTKFENAMRVAQEAKKDLERAEQLHNEHFLLQLAEQNELAKIMNSMAMLDLSVMNTEEVIRLLLEATEQISSIKEQWARMIQFFSILAVRAESTQKVVVKDFVEVIQQAQTDNLLINPFGREFLVEMLIPAATDIESNAHLLFTMAKTYYAVSSEHMINQIAGISRMLTLQTDAARNAQLQQASKNTLVTSLKITQLAQERHVLYLQETRNRQAEYQTYITNLAASELQETIG